MKKEDLLKLKKELDKLSTEDKKIRDLYLRRLSLGKKPIIAPDGYDYLENGYESLDEFLSNLVIGEKLKSNILIDGKVGYEKGTLITKEIYDALNAYHETNQYDNVEEIVDPEATVDYIKYNAPILGPTVGYNSIDKPWLKNYSDAQIMEDSPLMSVYDYLYNENKNYLNEVAFEYITEKITYGKLFDNIDKAAKAYKKMGVKKGDIVTICSITTPQIIYSIFALNKIGAVSNIIDLRYPGKAIEHFINDAKSKYCVILDLCYNSVKDIIDKTGVEKVITISPVESEPKIIKGLAYLKGKKEGTNVKIENNNKYISWKKFIKQGKGVNLERTSFEENEPAVIIHTGGTTGIPKGVRLTNENINNVTVQIKNANVDTKRGFKFLNIMPPFIAYGLSLGLVTPMILGWRTRIVPKFEPEKFDELIIKYKPNGFMGVHTYFDSVMRSKKINSMDLSFIKIVLFGGMKVPAEAKKRINMFLKEHGSKAEASEGYSCTEADSAATKTIDGDNVLDSAGIPLVKTSVAAFVPGTNIELKPGEEGEICIKSPTVMLDYHNHEEETNKVKKLHEDGYWIHTEDIGYTDEYGRVYPKDRIKRLFPRSGFKVYPSRIENVFLSNRAVETCAVVKMNDKIDGHAPWAVIVLKDEYRGQEKIIKEELLKQFNDSDLPPYFEPVKFIFTDSLIYTDIGKVDYNNLEGFLSENFGDGLLNSDIGNISVKKLKKSLNR